MSPLQFQFIGGLIAMLVLTMSYLAWHHHVYQQGYQARIVEEQKTVATAQPVIKEGELKYEDLVKKIYAAPDGACGVDPAIGAVLDGLH